MKTLYIVRHAKSSWKEMNMPDFERPLNPRGKQDAPLMGRRLASFGICPDYLVSSSAKRALATANLLAAELGYPVPRIVQDRELYLAEPGYLLDTIRGFDNQHGSAMLLGHNPGLTTLANHLGDLPADNIPTCGVYCIDFEVREWRDCGREKGRCRFFEYPKKNL